MRSENSESVNIFSYKDYKKFLRAYFESQKKERGLSKRMAEAAECQPSYLSQVLSISSKIQITPDQALGITRFLMFNQDEQDYFLLLVDHARAVGKELQNFISQKILKIQTDRSDIGKKLSRVAPSDDAVLIKYYSSWVYAYVHILTSISEFQLIENISNKILLPTDQTFEILKELEQLNLVIKEGQRWKHSGKELHINSHSPMVTHHHNNWRQQAILNSQYNNKLDSVHFSGIYSITRSDFTAIKDKVMALLKDVNQISQVSGTEDVVVLCVDCFKK